ncbi:hypothetical protein VTI74DRAFT_1642 [Chaetomium olivicolor]
MATLVAAQQRAQQQTQQQSLMALQTQYAESRPFRVQQAASSGFGAPVQAMAPQVASFGFGNAAVSNTAPPLFGAPNVAPLPPAPAAAPKVAKGGAEYRASALEPQSYNPDADAPITEFDAQTMLEPTPEVTFQDSSFEETGLTATYDLPHLKTLKPSSTASKQRVARVSFSNITFARTVVAKYKPAAYLRARICNTSKLTLLKGPTGLTLDGTFLGRSTLPRCSAGDSFSIPLGVDPAIRVAYPKPEVTRSTTGVFSKGDNSSYTRSITLVNTRASAGKPVAITVLDQVPVSEDERLRVDVLHPAGLHSGKAMATGVPGKEGKEEMDWGKASAVLKKAGEVEWQVLLNAGKSVKLVLQYEVAFPTGERVSQVY